MVNYDEDDVNELVGSESIMTLFNSFDAIKKFDFFLKLIEFNSISEVISQFQKEQVEIFIEDGIDDSFELIQYVTPDGINSIICYEYGNIVNINTNNKKEYQEIVKNIFTAGDLITKIKEKKKNKLKYPHRFYGKYFILNSNEIYSLPMNLS